MSLFGTDGIRGSYGVHPITTEFAASLVQAVYRTFEASKLSTVLLGRDTRDSGPNLESSLAQAFSRCGVNVVSYGMIASPVLAHMLCDSPAQLGVMITASHNPSSDNGFKFFDAQGCKFSETWEDEVERNVARQISSESQTQGEIESSSDLEQYYIKCQSILGSLDGDPGLSVVVDCANGAMSRIAPEVFERLGFKVQCYGIHGADSAINDGCGSTFPEHIQTRVKENRADIGIAFDGDGDRVVLVDDSGTLIDGDQILYLLANWDRRTHRGIRGVVGTVMSNGALQDSLAKSGVSLVRVPVGDRNVAAELKKRTWDLGGEPSGHIINQRLSPTGDGLLTALQVLNAMCSEHKTLKSMLKHYESYPQENRSVRVSDAAKLVDSPVVQACIKGVLEKEHVSRVVVRPSGTEPVLRIMVEGSVGTDVSREADAIVDVVSTENITFTSPSERGRTTEGD